MIVTGSGKYIWPWMLSALFLLILYFINNSVIVLLLAIALISIGIFQLWFFRDPHRDIMKNVNHILSAADGTIKLVRLENSELQISIRMSPFNVHLNRYPVSAEVMEVFHTPGSHRNVYFGDAALKNEKVLTSLENDMLYCDVLQLTGMYARLIETWCDIGDQVLQGEKMGVIRFGSQTNMRIKLKNDDKDLVVRCKIGDKVEAGISILAEIR